MGAFYKNIEYGTNFNLANFKIPKKQDDTKYTAEELKDISLDQVKKWILEQDKTAFAEKKTAKKK